MPTISPAPRDWDDFNYDDHWYDFEPLIDWGNSDDLLGSAVVTDPVPYLGKALVQAPPIPEAVGQPVRD